ncbi:tyrosine-type recombinase/integrase [Rhodococcoides yunnanense]|jgi:integrase|uniref:tyrosine-type recombinase/integrase n=1 Tax=Rhodococcoides yunnanense TaxID=278209 RepID=UPI0022B09305|nr:tyrosine-type recombinase/integrase [Rhodococcus yunnanensis]MCZ4276258.1 tyrosine-type recombinase/integrase [Rhodococcus yunnanensis]
MATIESYETGAGKRWRVRYRTPERRQTQKRGFTSKRLAQDFAATVEVEMMRGEYVPPKLGKITVAEFGPDWLQRKESDLKPSAYKSIETAWRVHVKPRWGAVQLADITLDSVERWIADMTRAGKGATVVIRAYGVLAGVLDSAVKAKRLAKNPARGVENLPRKQRKAHVYLSHDEVELLAASAGQHRVLVLVLAYCGVRWGEAIGLRVRHLDLLRKRINIVDNAVQVEQQIHVGTPKSHKSRAVPVPAFLVAELAHACEGKGRDDLVFSGRGGEYLRRSVSSTGWFTRAVAKSGAPRLTPHDLRHTAASLAISAGVNVKALQRMLGHASAAMTLDVYADLFDDDLDAVGVALDRAVSARSVAKTWPDGTPAVVISTEKRP